MNYKSNSFCLIYCLLALLPVLVTATPAWNTGKFDIMKAKNKKSRKINLSMY